MLLKDVPVATPIFGVVSVGDVSNTNFPEPVSSEITPASSADVVAANTDNLFAVYATVPPAPNATDDVSVPVNVNVLLAVRVLPSAIVNVDPVAGAVIVTLFIDVADATPKVGVVSEGELLNTRRPVPVSSEITPANSAEVVAPNTLSLLAVRAIVPVASGNVIVCEPVKVAGKRVILLFDDPPLRPVIIKASCPDALSIVTPEVPSMYAPLLTLNSLFVAICLSPLCPYCSS